MVANCVYKGVTYTDGSVVCQEGREFRCHNGDWEPLGSECSEAGPPPAVAEEESPPDDGAA